MLCQFLVLMGNWQFFCCDGKFSLRPEKNRYSRLSGGCAINYNRKKKRYSPQSVGCAVLAITTGKKKIQSSVWRVRDQLRPEKKSYSRLSVGCAVLAITTGKKKDTVVCLAGARSITTGKKKDTVVYLLGARFWRLRPEKKRYSRLSNAVLAITTGKKKDNVVCLAGCAVVSVFGSGGKLAFFCSGGKF